MKLKKGNKLLILSLLISFLFAIAAFMYVEINSNNQQFDDDNYKYDLKIANPYTDISAEVAYNMINDDIIYPDLIVLDVRTQEEYDSYHICNSILIPYTELESRISELDPYKDTEIIVYCGSGVRSEIACQTLDTYTFTKVYNMIGGIFAWDSKGYEVCTDDLNPPVWDEIPTDQLLEYGEAFNYDLDASDPSGIDKWWLNDTMYFDIDGNGLITNSGPVPIGEYWLEVSVNDTYGNTLIDSFKITVQDTIPPSWILPPSDKTMEFGGSFNYDLDAFDPSGIDEWWLNDTLYFDIDGNGLITNTGAVPVGEYGLEVSLNDTKGNVLTDTFKITVHETTPPSWVLPPSDKTMEYDDSFNYDIDATDPSGIDEWWLNDTMYFDIDGNGVITNKILVPIGEYWLEVSVNDTFGNTLTDFFKVTVQDTTSPSWVLPPSDKTMEYDDSFNYDLDATDPSGIDEWWLNDTIYFDIDGNGIITNKGLVPIGEYWLEVNTNDTLGNTIIDSFKITVQDTTSPSWVLPPSDKIMELGGTFHYDLNATDPSAVDDWWLNDTLYFDIDGNGIITNKGLVPIGEYWLEVNVNDTFGNILIDTFKITVQDTTPPSWLQDLSDKIMEFGGTFKYDLNASDSSGIDEWWLNDTIFFDIDGNGIITNIGLVPTGEYWLEVNVNNTVGNTLTDTFKITVQDTTSPSWILPPSDKIMELGDTFNYDLDATDLSGIDEWWLNESLYFDIDGNGIITNIGLVPTGEYWLEVSVNDTVGNILTDILKITIQDITPPSWVQDPSDKTLELGDTFNYDLNATDLSSIHTWGLNDTMFFEIDGSGIITNKSLVPTGVYWLEVNVNDTLSNILTDTFKITVQDTTSPSWILPPLDKIMELGDSFNYDLNATDLSGVGSWELNNTTYFNIDPNGVITNLTSINVGIYWLEVRVNDTFDNTHTGSFKITVQDTTPPSWVQDPFDKTLELGDTFNYDLDAFDPSNINTWWLNDTLYFKINGNGVITSVGLVPTGIYQLEVNVNDTFGNTLTDSFKITLEDTTPPSWASEPSDQYIDFGDGLNYDLDATDLSGIGGWGLNDTTYFNIDPNGVITNITSINMGIFWIEVQVNDTFDNQRTKALRVIVQDIDAPIWVQEPSDKNMEAGTTFNYDLNATDASGIDDWWVNDTTHFDINDTTGVITNIDQVPIGIYWLEVRAYDPYFQYCSAGFKITVEDTIGPTWDELPTDKSLEYGNTFYYDLSASDALGIDDWWLNDTTYFDINDTTGVITNIGQAPIGIYWLEIAVYDPSNHNCSATIKITVQDTTDPIWDELPTDQPLEYGDAFNYDLNASDASGITDWWLNDTTYFDIEDVTGIITNIGQVPIGIYWLEIAARDPSNHNCSVIIKIVVQDTTDPTWNEMATEQPLEYGEAFNYDLNASDTSGIDEWWLNNTTYFEVDNITGVITNIGQVPVGVYWLEVRAFDPYFHYCSVTIKITVQDTTAPIWIEIPIDQNLKFGDEFYYGLNASDASGIHHWWLNDTTNFAIDSTGVITNLILLEDGVHWLEVRAYDPHNHYCSCIFKIIVTNPTIPQDYTWLIVITGSSVGIAAILVITIIIVRRRRS